MSTVSAGSTLMSDLFLKDVACNLTLSSCLWIREGNWTLAESYKLCQKTCSDKHLIATCIPLHKGEQPAHGVISWDGAQFIVVSYTFPATYIHTYILTRAIVLVYVLRAKSKRNGKGTFAPILRSNFTLLCYFRSRFCVVSIAIVHERRPQNRVADCEAENAVLWEMSSTRRHCQGSPRFVGL